jgi:hypothetical protein
VAPKGPIVVLGTLAADPYAGMAWMHMQIVAGLRRLGREAYYFETTSNWPYDPVRGTKVCDSDYAVPYLDRVAASFGLDGCWAYRRSYSDKAWIGMPRERAERLLAGADAVFNVAGATPVWEEGLETGPLVYFGTDPVFDEVGYAAGRDGVRETVDRHERAVTYGENIGTAASPVPPLPHLAARTRQPVLLGLWRNGAPTRDVFTTVGNWRQEGPQVEFDGETYFWSKDREFRKIVDVPARTTQAIELATNLAGAKSILHSEEKDVRALGVDERDRLLLHENGWILRDALPLTTSPWPYRDYVRGSRAELTVARDLNVRLKSGWFSERSACYLAAGRPVIAQDTGFGEVLPLGEGLFAFEDADGALEAIEAVNGDYQRHSRAAAAIAEEHFAAERVLARLLDDLGL